MPQVRVLTDGETSAELRGRLRRLQEDAFEGRFDQADWEHGEGGWRVVVLDGAAPVAHVAVVLRALHVAGRRFRAGYVEGVATAPDRQGEGLGSLAMTRATGLVRTTFEMGGLSTSLPGFYRRFGWESWRGPTFVWDGAAVLRTTEEDDGVMVLRCGPSAGIDLAAPIACERRTGDDW